MLARRWWLLALILVSCSSSPQKNEEPVEKPPPPLGQAVPLTQEQASSLLKKLEPLSQPATSQPDFYLREGSLPPPRPGKTVEESFPPAASQPAPEASAVAGPLRVLRRSPDGEVAQAPNVSITFSQPMSTLGEEIVLTPDQVPAILTPQPEGQWRWVGDRTLLFEHKDELPKATEYTVKIPAGTKSTNGAALEQDVTFSFATPPPQVTYYTPSYGAASVELAPPITLSFNQNIDPVKVLAALQVTPKLPLKLTTTEKPYPSLTFAPTTEFPKNTKVTITLPVGAYSTEGPRPLQAAVSFSFQTYGPLRLVESICGYDRGEPCSPSNGWQFNFSNPIDGSKFDPKLITVTPAVEELQCQGSYEIYCSGKFKGDTRYSIKFSPDLTDIYGQKLGAANPVNFAIGPMEKQLSISTSEDFIVLDPAAKATISVSSVNYAGLKVELYQVAPEDYETHISTRYYYSEIKAEDRSTPPGKLFSSTIVNIKARNEEVKTEIDLSPALPAQLGNLLVVVTPTDLPVKDEYGDSYLEHDDVWVQATRLSFDAISDREEAFVFVQDLATGAPTEGAQLTLYPSGATASTSADGTAKLPLSANDYSSKLVVSKGSDVAFTPYFSSYGYGGRADKEFTRWFVFDDRGLYRPGEEVHLKGWMRRARGGKLGDLLGLALNKQVSYILNDSRGNEITKGTAPLNDFGGFELTLSLPDTVNLGSAHLNLMTPGFFFEGESHTHNVRIEEFRRPEFEVTAKASEGVRFVHDKAEVTVSARYYAGGPLPDAPVTWDIRATEASFTPPNQGEYTFGDNVWRWWHKKKLPELKEILATSQPTSGDRTTQGTEGFTAATGEHTVPLALAPIEPPRPYSVYAQATVQDINNQSWSANTTILVHPSSLYVGVKTEKNFAQKGAPVVLHAIVADLDGKLVAGREIKLSISHITEEFKEGAWKETRDDQQEQVLQSGAQKTEHIFTPQKGGTYEILAEVLDDQQRKNITALSLWVAGDDAEEDRALGADVVQIIADKKEYQPGDQAEVLLVAPFFPAEGVFAVNRGGVVSWQRFAMKSNTTTLKIPIKESHYPAVTFDAMIVGSKTRRNKAASQETKLASQPAFADGSLRVAVPPATRTLQVSATPKKKELAPGEKTDIEVLVKDERGKPLANAEVVLVVVDESVLSLSGYQIPDPLQIFYPDAGYFANKLHHRSWVQLAKEELLVPVTLKPAPKEPEPAKDLKPTDPFKGSGTDEELSDLYRGERAGKEMAAPKIAMEKTKNKKSAGDEGKMGKKPTSGLYMMKGPADSQGSPSGAITMRTDLNPLALFSGSTTTDAKGRVKLSVKLPDNLTRYRITALAADNKTRFGSAENTITATRPLMVRPSAPRFLNLGDQALVPVLVQNTGNKPLLVKVAMRAQDNVEIGVPGFLANVPANDRVELRFPVTAKKAGEVIFQVVAVSGRWNDANQFDLPIYTPATTEAQAVYGFLDEGAISQALKLPEDVYLGFGGLEVTTSSTALATLSDAVLYLVRYPFECAEQLSSRVLGVAALRDVLTAFDAPGLPSVALMEATVLVDLKLLEERQNYDGGFGFWKKGDESWPYLSLHVAHAAARAKAKGYKVSENLLYGANRYLENIEYLPLTKYSQPTKDMLLAYALYIRQLLGTGDAARARRLFTERGVEKLPLESLGWLMMAMAPDAASAPELALIKTHLSTRVTETADAAHFTTDYGDDYGYLVLSSDRRTDAILLEALIKVDPKSDLIPKLVVGLTKQRKAGHWGNTQENVFVLLALDAYFNAYEKITPDFVAKLWLGETFAGEQAFTGRSTDRKRLSLPFSVLEKTPSTQLILQKEGAGRLYYRIGMSYAPKDLMLKAASYGFTVERLYEAVDNADDVKREQDGTWRIKAGSRVRVKLKMIAPTRRYHVALVDPLPAGLEVQNEGLANTRDNAGSKGSGTTGKSRRYEYWWYRWYEFENKRDERVEAFTSLLWEGTYTYDYTTLATTPGTFTVPPTKAEEMYSPETFGRAASDKVIIEAAPNQL